MRSVWILTAIAATINLAAATAQVPDVRSPPKVAAATAQVSPGNYKALDFWGKLKLGSAYYVDPKVVRDAKVAYSFDPKDFVAAGKSPELWTLANDGAVTFGVPDKVTSSVKVVSISELFSDHKGYGEADLVQLLTSKDISVVAAKNSLLGSTALQTLVRAGGGG